MNCSICGKEMVESEVETTFMRDVYRCRQCGGRRSRTSAGGWMVRGGLFVLSSMFGAPIDFGWF